MTGLVLPALLALAAALVRAALVPSLPGPLAVVDPVLVLACWYAVAHRPREAFVAAAVAGIARDALSALPAGSHLLAYCAATFVAYLLFTRIFTNHGWPGLLGLGAAAMAVDAAVLVAIRRLGSMVDGFGLWSALPTGADLGNWLKGLALHLVVMLVTFAIVAMMEDGMSRRAYRR